MLNTESRSCNTAETFRAMRDRERGAKRSAHQYYVTTSDPFRRLTSEAKEAERQAQLKEAWEKPWLHK